MSEREIWELIGGFERAAARARESGFDGVELFAAYHALIDQFWTPWSNRRTDGWGGSFEARMRFSATLLDRVRAACGDDFVVGLAVNLDPGTAPSLAVEDLQEIVAWHDERALMDYVTCGTGSYFDFFTIMPTSLYPARLGEPHAAALEGGHAARAGAGREPHPNPPGRRGGAGGRPRRHGVHRPRADRRPSPGGQGPGRDGPRRCVRASRATSSVGGGAPATTGSRV